MPPPGAREHRQAALLVALAADLDGDHTITAKERKGFLKNVPVNRRGRLDPQAAVGIFIKAAIEKVASKISQGEEGEEASEHHKRGEGGERSRRRPSNVFVHLGRFLDSNGDGEVGQATIDELFASLDRNADGALSPGELGGRPGGPGGGNGGGGRGIGARGQNGHGRPGGRGGR